MNSTDQPQKTKKIWQKPDFYLLDGDSVNLKNQPALHEGTAHQVLTSSNINLVWVKGSKTHGNYSFGYLANNAVS